MMCSLLLVADGAVFVSELMGDKTLFTIGALSMRFRPPYVFVGLSLAYMLKMLAAVSLGRLIAELPTDFVGLPSAAIFLVTSFASLNRRSNALLSYY
jgi:putative Ca2+/H+ antiporter (TMEM165/GDT1 family)